MKSVALILLSLVFASAPGIGTSHAAELKKSPAAVKSGTMLVPVSRDSKADAHRASPVETDPCLSFLNNVRQPSDSSSNRNRRTAGAETAPAVVMGLVLGLRHAPGPLETLKNESGRPSSQPSDKTQNAAAASSPAWAVANYRRCKTENALKEVLDQGGEQALKL